MDPEPMEAEPVPVSPRAPPVEVNRPEEGGPSQVRPQGHSDRKRKLILTSEGDEEPGVQETTPQKKKLKARRKTTPLNQRPKEAGDDEEETGEEGDREQGPPTGEEPVREAGPSGGTQEEGEAPLRLENIILKTRVALDMVTEQYTPVFAALQEAGTLLRTDDALKYPARIRKLQRKLLRSREKESELAGRLQGLQEEERESAVLLQGLEEELQRKVAYIEKMEAHVRRNEIRIREQEDIIRG